jgi:hypothetical protein
MRVVYREGSVNQRRYGRVWIALVTSWPIGKRPVIAFGVNISYDEAEIAAKPGDLLKAGRRDYRGSNSANDFYKVAEDASLEPLSESAARNYWLEIHPENA